MQLANRFRLKIYIVLAGMVILSMLISLSLAYFLAYDQQMRQIQLQMLQTVQDKASLLGEWVGSKIAILDIAEAMRRETDPPLIPPAVLAAHGVSDVYEGRSDGTFVSYTRWRPPEGFDPRVRPWYLTILGQNTLCISDPYLDMNTGVMAVSLGRPASAPPGISAVLAADIPIQAIIDQIARIRFTDFGFVWILNERGQFVYHPDSRIIYQDIRDVEPIAGLPANSLLQRPSGEARYQQQGHWLRALYAPIPNSQWTLGLTVQDDQALSHLARLKSIYLALSTILSLIFAGLAYVMTRILAAPLLSIINFVRGVTQGQLDQRLSIHFNQEVDALAASLNTMAERLQTSFAQIEAQKSTLAQYNVELEKLVEARTRDLQDAYRRLEAAYQTSQTLAATDPLTGIANRRGFFEQAEKEVSRSLREQTPIGIMQLDLDNFKQVNDTHGHAAGDAVLIQATRVMAGCLRHYDLLGRLGGEEFAILLPDTPLDEVCRIAERIRLSIDKTKLTQDGIDIPMSVSIGISYRSDGTERIEKLLAEADCALYMAKAQGKNRVIPYLAGL